VQTEIRQPHSKDPSGLTPESILESTAFLVQKRAHRPWLDAEEYREMLDKNYKKPYDLAAQYLGEDVTFSVLPLFASLSLWTNAPSVVFQGLCMWGERNLEYLKSMKVRDLGYFIEMLHDVQQLKDPTLHIYGPSDNMIPMEIATHKNHTCGGRQQQEDMHFSI
jgi:hypothetical protein